MNLRCPTAAPPRDRSCFLILIDEGVRVNATGGDLSDLYDGLHRTGPLIFSYFGPLTVSINACILHTVILLSVSKLGRHN